MINIPLLMRVINIHPLFNVSSRNIVRGGAFSAGRERKEKKRRKREHDRAIGGKLILYPRNYY